MKNLKSFSLINKNNNKPIQNCMVIVFNNKATLKSYNIDVAKYDLKTNKMDVIKTHSNTTRKHLNAFLEFYGFDSCTKKEFKKFYNAG